MARKAGANNTRVERETSEFYFKGRRSEDTNPETASATATSSSEERGGGEGRESFTRDTRPRFLLWGFTPHPAANNHSAFTEHCLTESKAIKNASFASHKRANIV
jgi:hypothetical protein